MRTYKSSRMHCPPQRSQRGVALIFTLIIVAMLAIAATVGLDGSTTQMKVARNDELRIDALARAQNLLDSATVIEDNFPVSSKSGRVKCLVVSRCVENDGQDQAGQNQQDLSDSPLNMAIDSSLIVGAEAARSDVQIIRKTPLFTPPPRSLASSAGLFKVASFDVQANYNGNADSLGSATVGQTIMVMAAGGSQ